MRDRGARERPTSTHELATSASERVTEDRSSSCSFVTTHDRSGFMETLEASHACRLCGNKSGISINIFDKKKNHIRKINAVLPIMVRAVFLAADAVILYSHPYNLETSYSLAGIDVAIIMVLLRYIPIFASLSLFLLFHVDPLRFLFSSFLSPSFFVSPRTSPRFHISTRLLEFTAHDRRMRPLVDPNTMKSD